MRRGFTGIGIARERVLADQRQIEAGNGEEKSCPNSPVSRLAVQDLKTLISVMKKVGHHSSVGKDRAKVLLDKRLQG